LTTEGLSSDDFYKALQRGSERLGKLFCGHEAGTAEPRAVLSLPVGPGVWGPEWEVLSTGDAAPQGVFLRRQQQQQQQQQQGRWRLRGTNSL